MFDHSRCFLRVALSLTLLVTFSTFASCSKTNCCSFESISLATCNQPTTNPSLLLRYNHHAFVVVIVSCQLLFEIYQIWKLNLFWILLVIFFFELFGSFSTSQMHDEAEKTLVVVTVMSFRIHSLSCRIVRLCPAVLIALSQGRRRRKTLSRAGCG